MIQGKPRGALAERAKYCEDMARLLSQRIQAYEKAFDDKRDETGYGSVVTGHDVDSTCSPTNIRRMIVQLRMELLELGGVI